MVRQTKRAPLALSEEDEGYLGKLSRSATAPVREATRAKVLLKYAGGMSIARIQREVGVSRPTIYKCIDKALAAGPRAGLKDRHHRPRAPEILPDAKAWAISVACQSPKALGLAAELWTLSALTRYLQGSAEAAGYPRLARISRSSVWKLLQEEELKPHRVRYYLERRDPDFERKMRDVLMVYRDEAGRLASTACRPRLAVTLPSRDPSEISTGDTRRFVRGASRRLRCRLPTLLPGTPTTDVANVSADAVPPHRGKRRSKAMHCQTVPGSYRPAGASHRRSPVYHHAAIVSAANLANIGSGIGGESMETLSAKDAKCGFGRLIDLARAEPMVVTSQGSPVVVGHGG